MTRMRHILVLYRRVEKTPIKIQKKDPKAKKKGLFCHVKNAQKKDPKTAKLGQNWQNSYLFDENSMAKKGHPLWHSNLGVPKTAHLKSYYDAYASSLFEKWTERIFKTGPARHKQAEKGYVFDVQKNANFQNAIRRSFQRDFISLQLGPRKSALFWACEIWRRNFLQNGHATAQF